MCSFITPRPLILTVGDMFDVRDVVSDFRTQSHMYYSKVKKFVDSKRGKITENDPIEMETPSVSLDKLGECFGQALLSNQSRLNDNDDEEIVQIWSEPDRIAHV